MIIWIFTKQNTPPPPARQECWRPGEGPERDLFLRFWPLASRDRIAPVPFHAHSLLKALLARAMAIEAVVALNAAHFRNRCEETLWALALGWSG